MKHKSIKLHWLIITLYMIILNLESITRADKDFNSNTTTRTNSSFHLQHLTVETSKFEFQSFTDEIYTLKKTAIHDTVIRLENTSVFLSNANLTGCKILASGAMDYLVLFENCVFEGSEIVIDSASNVTIMNGQFIMEDIAEDEEPSHAIRIYNTGFVYMTNTHFGNKKIQHNQNERGHSKILNSTNLGMKMENILFAELIDCTFTGIKSAKNNGSAVLLKNTQVLIVSCELYLNIARNGVIFGINSVNITSSNSSFISNYAAGSGVVFYLTNSSTLTNDGSIFQNNSAREHGGVLYAQYDVRINNKGCLFQYNSADMGNGSVIWMQYNCQLNNGQVEISKNVAFQCGAVCMLDNCTVVNVNSLYSGNVVKHADAAAVYGKRWCNVTNVETPLTKILESQE